MSYTQCSVCRKKVDAEKNMIAEHKDQRGNVCYGSFTPVQNFDPFHVRRSVPILQPWSGVQPEPAGLAPWDGPEEEVPPPAYNYEYDGGYDDQFMNELRNLS